MDIIIKMIMVKKDHALYPLPASNKGKAIDRPILNMARALSSLATD